MDIWDAPCSICARSPGLRDFLFSLYFNTGVFSKLTPLFTKYDLWDHSHHNSPCLVVVLVILVGAAPR
jgi:hypothetical protein